MRPQSWIGKEGKSEPSGCHQTRCFLEEWWTCSGPWPDGSLSANPELCLALAPLPLDLFIQIRPLCTSVSLGSASVPILSFPHVSPAHPLTPPSPPPPAVAGYPALGSNACPGRAGKSWEEPWPFPGQGFPWQETGHSSGGQAEKGTRSRETLGWWAERALNLLESSTP